MIAIARPDRGWEEVFAAALRIGVRVGLPEADAEDEAQQLCIFAWQRGGISSAMIWNGMRAAAERRRRRIRRSRSIEELGENHPCLAIENSGLIGLELDDAKQALIRACEKRAALSPRRPSIFDWAAMLIRDGPEAFRRFIEEYRASRGGELYEAKLNFTHLRWRIYRVLKREGLLNILWGLPARGENRRRVRSHLRPGRRFCGRSKAPRPTNRAVSSEPRLVSGGHAQEGGRQVGCNT